MKKKVVLLLQGGGALGAFQCGVWQALAPFLRENDYELVAVAGASIGAINASLIARHYQDSDAGSTKLQEFWRTTVAQAPAPFIPLPGEYWRAWNGLLTGFLLGNPSLFSPNYHYWNFLGDCFRFHMPLYQTKNAESTLEKVFSEYKGTAPLLAVAASDVQSGEGVLFDSDSLTITPRIITSSIAIPLLFPPVEIEGRKYWDFEVRSNTLLPEVMKLLQEKLPSSDKPEDMLVIVVDMFKADAASTPTSAIQSEYRMLNIILGNKLKYDEAAIDAGNEHIDTIEQLHNMLAENDTTPVAKAIRQAYQKLVAKRRNRIEILHIGRDQFEFEYISRDFDYSPDYIERLITQGHAGASRAIKQYQEKSPAFTNRIVTPIHRISPPSDKNGKFHSHSG